MWVKVGTQGEIRTDDNHDKCYGYTAIDYVSCKTHYRMAEDFNGREFLLFIEQLQRQYAGETVVIVMDNAPAHGYRKIHGEVKVNEQLYFYFLPPYPPPNSIQLRKSSVSFVQRLPITNTFQILPT